MRVSTSWLPLVLVATALGCGEAPVSEPPDLHAPQSFESAEALLSFGARGEQPTQVKFVLTSFDHTAGQAFFMDPDFYHYHDEWYWFRLVNGVSVPGMDVAPVQGSRFETVEEAYAYYQGAEDMPLDLQWSGDGTRLYSPHFYQLALGSGAEQQAAGALGVGSIVHYEPNEKRLEPEELWLFELEYGATPDEATISKYMEWLAKVLPADVSAQLKWLARPSLFQHELAEQLRAGSGPLSDKVLTYKDLVVVGETVAYNPGIVAGRVRIFTPGTLGGASVGPEDIVVTEDVPDYLPPVAGIVSAVPQTPLAHLNLLAKARGTPNAYVGGVSTDPKVTTWAYYKTPVILEVTETEVRWAPLTEEEFADYRAKLGGGNMSISPIDFESAPHFVNLSDHGLEDLQSLTPVVGGKSAGFLALQAIPEVSMPPYAMAISVRGYHEHLSWLKAVLEAMLDDDDFGSDLRARFLVLEGQEDFEEEHASDSAALSWLETFLASHGEQTLLGSIVAAGGIKAMVRDRALDADYLNLLKTQLKGQFGALAPTQGLRFRSSSTAEDVPGFNGAGLYDSNTGFLDPTLQELEKDQKRSVEWALKKTWASYWAFEAFEERASAGIDHLSGNMGVLVHPRFDDPKERANAVITFSLALRPDGDVREMVLNVQAGALSVTNPVPGNPAQPEIDRVIRHTDGELQIERVQPSTEVAAGAWVLSTEELHLLFEQTEAVAETWLEQTNSALTAEAQRSTTMLDFEMKKMDVAWPALESGEELPARLVLKQVRSLEPKASISASDLQGATVPADLLAVTESIQLRTCAAEGLSFQSLELYTSKAAALIEHAELPFAAWLSVSVDTEQPGFPEGFGLAANEAALVTHLGLGSVERPGMPSAGWSIDATLTSEAAAEAGFTSLALDDGGSFSLSNGAITWEGAGLACEVEDLVQGAAQYLTKLLNEKLAD